MDRVGFVEMISVRLMVCHFVSLRRCHSGPSKDSCMLIQNWSKVEALPRFA